MTCFFRVHTICSLNLKELTHQNSKPKKITEKSNVRRVPYSRKYKNNNAYKSKIKCNSY